MKNSLRWLCLAGLTVLSLRTANAQVVPPFVSALVPNNALAGTTVVLSVQGSGFVQGDVIVWFESESETSTRLSTTFVSPNELRATLTPSLLTHPPRTVSITVAYDNSNPECNLECYAYFLPFTINLNLQLTQITPNRANLNTGVTLSATGLGFDSSSTLIWRRGETEIALATTLLSGTQLQGTIAPSLLSSPGTAEIFVQNGLTCEGACPSSGSVPFTILDNLTLTSVTPNTAPTVGVSGPFQDIQLTGTGFAADAQVFWQVGSQQSQVQVLSRTGTTQLTARIPAALLAAPVSAAVFVRNPASGSLAAVNSNARPFTVFLGLALTSIRPAFGTTRTSTDITATGTGFNSGSVLVWRRGGAETTLSTVFVSATELRTTIPAGLAAETGTAEIFVQNGSLRSSGQTFSIVDRLILSRIDPDGAPVREASGAPQDIRLNGSGFSAEAQVLWQSAAQVRQLEVFDRSGSTELRARVPASLLTTPQSVLLTVRNPGTAGVPDRESNALQFTVFVRLTLTRLQPASVSAGSPAIQLSASGTGFTGAARLRLSSAAGTFTPSTQTVDAGQGRIDATIGPELLLEPTTYRVAAFEGRAVSNELEFRVVPGVTISSIDPTSRPAGSGPFQLTIRGSGFTQGTQVLFGETQLAPSSITATQILVNAVAPATVGAVNVRVRLGDVQSNSVAFTVTNPAPILSSLDPAVRTVNSGPFELRITGQNLSPNPAVSFDGQNVPVISSGPTEVRVQIANALLETPRTALVQVRVGTADSNILNFTIVPAPPSISSLSPSSRIARSGDFELTVTGQNLTPNPAVRFDGEPVPVVGTPTATSVRVFIADARIQQPRSVVVTVEVGPASTQATFTVTAPLVAPPAVTVANAMVQPGGNTETRVTLSDPAPVPLTGTLSLTFTPDAVSFDGLTDPALVFVANGTRTLPFTLPVGQTEAQIPEGGRINVGTVAGTIFVRIASLAASGQSLPAPPDSREIVVPRSGPVLTPGSVRLVNSTGGVTVEVSGYAPSRQITQATIAFTIATGTDVVGSTSFTVPIEPAFTTWFSSQAGRQNGSRFLLRIPFTVEEGDANRITGVTVTLTSPEGQTSLTGTR